ncbi:hypothetical protein GCM10023148_09250 [Actinokineospora soli]
MYPSGRGPAARSTTSTSHPARRNHHASVIPAIPAPQIKARTATS